MAKRGVVLIYKTVREWCFKLGRIYAKRIRSRNCPSRKPVVLDIVDFVLP
jgi:transposase-like protein